MSKHIHSRACFLLLAGFVAFGGSGALATVAPHRTSAAASDTLTYGSDYDPDTLNPISSGQGTNSDIATATFDSLLVPDPRGRLQPDLATSVEHSADGRTWTFHLRHGVQWSDGVPFTSADVAYNYRAMLDKRHNVAITNGWDQIDRSTTPGPYTFVCHLKAAYAPFLVWVAQSLLIPEHIYDRPGVDFNHTSYNRTPIGTGAYVVKEWITGDHLTLVPNPYWWRGRPSFQKVIYKVVPNIDTLLVQLRTGELDMGKVIQRQAHAASALPGKRLVSWLDNSYKHIEFTQWGFLREKVVRQALDYATPKQAIFSGISNGLGAIAYANVLPTFAAFYNPNAPRHPFSLARAAAILAGDRFIKGPGGTLQKNGTPFALTLWATSNDTNGQKINQVLQQEWGQLGIMVTLATIDGGALYSPGGPYFSKAMAGIVTITGNIPDPDDSPFWVSSAIPKTPTDTTCCNSMAYLHHFDFQAQIDALYLAGNSTIDPAKRRAIYFKIQAVLADEVPTIFLYWISRQTVLPNDLTGYVSNPFYPPFAQVGSWHRD